MPADWFVVIVVCEKVNVAPERQNNQPQRLKRQSNCSLCLNSSVPGIPETSQFLFFTASRDRVWKPAIQTPANKQEGVKVSKRTRVRNELSQVRSHHFSTCHDAAPFSLKIVTWSSCPRTSAVCRGRTELQMVSGSCGRRRDVLQLQLDFDVIFSPRTTDINLNISLPLTIGFT